MGKFLLIVLCVLVAEVRGNCDADLQSGKTSVCLNSLMVKMQRADPSNINEFCTPDVIENLDCLGQFAKACPNSVNTGPLAYVLPQVQQFKTMCAMIGGGDGGGHAGEGAVDCDAELQGGGVSICLQDLMGAMQKLDPKNPSAVCTAKVISDMNCLGEFLKACPQVAKSGPFATVVPHLENFQMMCNKLSGAGPGGNKCPELMACNERVQTLSQNPEMTPGGTLTPFSMVPVMVYSLCTVGKQQQQCFDENRAKCPALVATIEEGVKTSFKMDNTTLISYDDVKAIMRDECPKIDPDFPSNKCVRQKLESRDFVNCMMQVKQLSAQAARAEHCKYYFDGKACMEEYIGKPCGQKNGKVLVDTAHWVIHDLPQDCDKHKPVMITTVAPKPGNNPNPDTKGSGIKDPDTTTRDSGKSNSGNPENAGMKIRVSLGTILVFIVVVLL